MHSIELLDTMAPTDYMTIRTGLGRGSGQESPGFRTMLRLPGELVWPAVTSFLEFAFSSTRKDIQLEELTVGPESELAGRAPEEAIAHAAAREGAGAARPPLLTAAAAVECLAGLVLLLAAVRAEDALLARAGHHLPRLAVDDYPEQDP